MSEIKKSIRRSIDGLTEYQIEYKMYTGGVPTEYRVRRGSRGTWVKWLRTRDIKSVLRNLGFGVRHSQLTLLNEFYFESYFGRGEIRLNTEMAKTIAGLAGIDEFYTHFYSSMKRVSDDGWVLPASALKTRQMFDSMKELIETSI